MIIQCDQCSTKFKLDDAKLTEAGVKVRCRKCQHIFQVQREHSPEEPDFDVLLQGLHGGSVPQSPPSAPPVVPQEPCSATVETSFVPVDLPNHPSNSLPLNIQSQHCPASISTSVPDESPSPAHFNEFTFTFDPLPSESPEASQQSSKEFGEIDFAAFSEKPNLSSAATELSSGESALTFDTFSVMEQETASCATNSSDEATQEIPDSMSVPSDSFSFTFDDEPTPQMTTEDMLPSSTPSETNTFEIPGWDQNHLETSEPAASSLTSDEKESVETGSTTQTTTPPTTSAETVFPEYNFDNLVIETPAPETPSMVSHRSAPHAPLIPQEPATLVLPTFPTEPDSMPAEFPLHDVTSEASAAPVPQTPLRIETLAFSYSADSIDTSSVATGTQPFEKSDTLSLTTLPAGYSEMDSDVRPSASTTENELGGDQFSFESEEPPASLSCRRQGPSLMGILGLVLMVIIVGAVAGIGGIYVFKGPETLKKLGLGGIVRLLGTKKTAEERIELRNIEGYYLTNAATGELFVIKGEAFNSFKSPRAAIQVRGLIYNSAGTVILQKTAYCGNILSPEQLNSLPMTKIDETMNNRLGDALANIGTPSNRSVPFAIIFANLPKEAADYAVEVVGSQATGQ